MLSESDIKTGLITFSFGRKDIHIFNEIDSTNDRAYKLADNSAPEGTIVIAESQSSGKGRSGRKWISIPGQSLSFSIILKPEIDIAKTPGLTLVIAVALSDTLHHFGVHTHKIKWPNDILINNRKIAGILTEMKAMSGKIVFIISGIGINTGSVLNELPEDLKSAASSILDETGIVIDRTGFLQTLLQMMEIRYNEFVQSGLENILKDWKENSDLIGKKISFILDRQRIEGDVKAINDDGSLNIETGSGTLSFNSGEITIL